ncbi:ABC transporter substrate-binding protein [Rhizobium sp. LC145]|jgi:oligogalacturonide transport system substrate-binding protein|uniref:ABC transporter substrate-binding protein n=1 Tax=Rhizobium sp. LC145 TaxID=1120688 RepID=UPI000629F11F|nr:ABC transporter substrate-binding protein [Rhizobium sp. LC145]KKX33177.1 sugar ABC transporter substrate-binding protein [Rhizobium sp. LC145]TKT68662.1 carbohydrate ABC transporter substrate-binding protein [Rhizobiaceae bacterium LC148]
MKTRYMLAALASAAVTTLALSTAVQAAELRMAWWGGESRHVATQKAAEACGVKHGHTVKGEFTGFDGYLEKLTTQMAGMTEADIMQVNWPWLPLFSKNGNGFADLRTLKGLDLANWTDADLAAGSMNGVLQGLPVSTTGRVFFFNKTTFDKAGVAIPTNWDEFFTATKAIKEKLGSDHYTFNAVKETAHLVTILAVTQATGKDMVDPATNRVAWTPEELAQGINFLGKLVESGAIRSQKEEAADGNVNLFEKPAWAEGRIAGSYEWDSTYSKYADPLKEGQVLEPVPMLKLAGAVTDGVYRKPSMVFSISKHSKDPEAAAEILNCLLNEPEGIDALGTSRGIPTSKAALERLGDSDKPEVRANKIVMASSGPVVSPFNEHPEIRGAFIDTLEEYAYGQIDADGAAEQIIDTVNDVLAKFD